VPVDRADLAAQVASAVLVDQVAVLLSIGPRNVQPEVGLVGLNASAVPSAI
jgi:hypothetical protein